MTTWRRYRPPFRPSALGSPFLTRHTQHTQFSDEDDGADTNTLRARWQHYFTESSDHAVRLIDSSKENGDSAHLGVARVGGAIFPVLGSKLVHLIVGTADHVELYPEAEFRHAKGYLPHPPLHAVIPL